jgi:hypothetical protein
MLDGVVGGKYDQTDRCAAGDTTVDVEWQMFDQPGLDASWVIGGDAGWLAHE